MDLGSILQPNTAISMDGIPVSSDISVPDEPIPAETVVIPETPVQAVTEELGGVATETAKLAELQVQLFESECIQSLQKLVQPIWILSLGITCGTASLMILFHALGWALHDIFGWSVSLSLFIVAVVGTALTGLALQIAWSKLKEPRISFAKSKAELMRNVQMYASLLQRPK